MKWLRFLLILLTIVLACQKENNSIKHSYKFIPNETSTVIQINNLKAFVSSIENHNILSSIYNKELRATSKVLQNLNTTKQIYIAFSQNIENKTNYLILTENNTDLFKIDSIPNHNSETITGFNIEKSQIEEGIFYHKIIGRMFAASDNIDILKNLDAKKENSTLSRLIEITDNKSVASIIFKSDNSKYSKLLFINSKKENGKANYTAIDIGYTNDNLKYNGILIANDSISNNLDSFKQIIPQKVNATAIAPHNTRYLTSITYGDFSVLNNNLNQLNKQQIDSTQTFLNFANEIALIEDAVILHSYDTDLILDYIEEKTTVETFRDIEIFQFNDPHFFASRLKPFIAFKNAKFLSAYNEFILFSDSIDHLKTILTDAINTNTLANSEAFVNISEHLNDKASLFIFKNSDGLSEILGQKVKGYNANVVQYIYENNYAHINGVIKTYKKNLATNSISENFSVQLEAESIIAPQTVKNHITKTQDIVVQDANYILYLISNSGKILWKKQLPNKVLGKIEQIDRYKNGRLQLAFATVNRIFMLDRNGKDVSPFPLKFKDKITQPLSVFNYDNVKNYRLLVTQGKHLLMYNANGESVKGFNYKSSNSVVSSQPKHFRIAKKDYIVFSAGEQLKILNRKGQTRLVVKDKIRFSDNELYLYKNKFTASNTLGQLIQVDSRGKLSTTNLNLSDKHHIEATSKTMVAMAENRLKIKSKTIDLDYGDYTKPRICYLNDKIYITVTDKQSKKVYVFDSQAKLIPNFPIYGITSAELTQLDRDSNLELITQSDTKTIVVYNIN